MKLNVVPACIALLIALVIYYFLICYINGRAFILHPFNCWVMNSLKLAVASDLKLVCCYCCFATFYPSHGSHQCCSYECLVRER